MRIVHTIINNAYTIPYINFINSNFHSNEHVFYVIRGLKESKCSIPRIPNVYRITTGLTIFNGLRLVLDLVRSEKIILHGLFQNELIILLFILRFLLKKCFWVVWGGDLYDFLDSKSGIKSNIIESLKAKVLCKCEYLLTDINGDFDLAIKWYKITGKRISVFYTMPVDFKVIDELVFNQIKIENDFKNVCIGNSATESNNHIEVLNFLTKFYEKSINVYVILSYGDTVYANKIIDYGKELFGDRFFPIVEYMDYNNYVLFLNKMDIIILNHTRQQAFHNIVLCLYLRKKIFVNPDSTLFNYFLAKGCNVFNLSKVTTYDEFCYFNYNLLDINKQNVLEFQNSDNVRSLWQEVFNLKIVL